MTVQEARELAASLGSQAHAHQSGGNIWIVLDELPDGRFRVHGEGSTAIYASRAAWEQGQEPISSN